MRLMYHNFGVVRENKELIRHRMFMTKLKPGCEEEYKAKLSAREVNFWFDGKPAEFIAALSNNQSLSKEDIKQIRGLLDEMDQ